MEGAREVAEGVAESLEGKAASSVEDREALTGRIASQQEAVGYSGDFTRWLEEVGEPS